MLVHVIIMLLSCVTHVIGQFQCQGTCYKGSFPKGNDVTRGKHLQGYSYKNITTDVPHVCFSSCVGDCRCKAFQMKSVKCELLDEDKTSKAADFVNEAGYVYYDLKQKLYKGKSHMVQPTGSCDNGCCRSQPCQNGGTCGEHCDNPKEKFSCTCSKFYSGRVCEKELTPEDLYFNSCLDVLDTYIAAGKMPGNGVYRLRRLDKPSKDFHRFFCAFEGVNKTWTLIESFSLANMALYKRKSFADNFIRHFNMTKTIWTDYRVSVNAMQHFLEPNSTMFRATCDFPVRESLTPDFLLGYLSDCDIINFHINFLGYSGGGQTSETSMKGHCCKFVHINIRGHDFRNTTAPVWHIKGSEHVHIDPTYDHCNFSVPGSLRAEDIFGFYDVVNPNSTCTATKDSTTQWWLGQEK